MARDECRDCGTWSPEGAGLTEGRCPRCNDAFLARGQVQTLPPGPEEPPAEILDAHLEV